MAVLTAIGLIVASLGFAAPASASPSSFPTTVDDCKHGGWAGFSGIDFRNQGQCVAWVQHTIVREGCLPAALDDFATTGPTYAAELGLPLSVFIATVCHGQDFPVSNNSYVVNDPAGTDLVSLASGNTLPFITQPGHIYWIEVQGSWHDGLVRQVDARYISDDNWATYSDGPSPDPRNLETQINGQFVDWVPYAVPFDPTHNYSYWIWGDGNPITMRVFEGDPSTDTPNPAGYADNTGPAIGGVSMPAIVFEYTEVTP